MSQPKLIEAYTRKSDTIISCKDNYAEIRRWPNLSYKPTGYGYFVASEGDTCILATELKDTIGVTVENPGFVTGSSKFGTTIDGAGKLKADCTYVAFTGITLVRVDDTITDPLGESCYCIPSNLTPGYATKSSSNKGYRVVGLRTVGGVRYAMIDLTLGKSDNSGGEVDGGLIVNNGTDKYTGGYSIKDIDGNPQSIATLTDGDVYLFGAADRDSMIQIGNDKTQNTTIYGDTTISGNVQAVKFYGGLEGTATRAIKDGNSNTITSYYTPKSVTQDISDRVSALEEAPSYSAPYIGWRSIFSNCFGSHLGSKWANVWFAMASIKLTPGIWIVSYTGTISYQGSSTSNFNIYYDMSHYMGDGTAMNTILYTSSSHGGTFSRSKPFELNVVKLMAIDHDMRVYLNLNQSCTTDAAVFIDYGSSMKAVRLADYKMISSTVD